MIMVNMEFSFYSNKMLPGPLGTRAFEQSGLWVLRPPLGPSGTDCHLLVPTYFFLQSFYIKRNMYLLLLTNVFNMPNFSLRRCHFLLDS